jgi:valyl-tRNA synthetase
MLPINFLLARTHHLVVGGGITVATTRPETILGDIAICVNPADERYSAFIGKEVLVPIINRKIPIIADEYVTADFGTGCLKNNTCP